MYRLTDLIVPRTAECDLWEIKSTLAGWLPLANTEMMTTKIDVIVRRLAAGDWTIGAECAYLGIDIEMVR